MLWLIAALLIALKLAAVITVAWSIVLIPVFVIGALVLFQIVAALVGTLAVRKVAKKIDGKW